MSLFVRNTELYVYPVVALSDNLKPNPTATAKPITPAKTILPLGE